MRRDDFLNRKSSLSFGLINHVMFFFHFLGDLEQLLSVLFVLSIQGFIRPRVETLLPLKLEFFPLFESVVE